MKKMISTAISFMLIISFIVGSPASAIASGETEQKVIKVTGEGIVWTAPDRAKITLAVVTEDKNARQAQADNAQKTNKLISALKAAGIDDQDIKTSNYRLQPKYSYEEKRGPQLTGYTVVNEVVVTVRQIDRIGQILDLAVQNGANEIRDIRYYAEENVYGLKVKALQQALADAQAKAEVIAGFLGTKLTGVISATGEWHDVSPPPVYLKDAGAGNYTELGTTPINPDLVQIRGWVEITYSIN